MVTHLKHNFTVASEHAGVRFDVVVKELLPEQSRSRIVSLIKQGSILLNNKTSKPSTSVMEHDVISWEIPEPRPSSPQPQNINLDIMYQDSDLLVINKQAGLVVHPGPGNHDATMVNALLYHCHDLSGIGGEIRPGIIHRLDKGTSGLMLVAKNDNAHNILSHQFSKRTIKKEYLALAMGLPSPLEDTIDTPYGRHPTHRKKYTGKIHTQKRAISIYKVITANVNFSLISILIKTGRTHQIRVHMAERGHPLIGENLYGNIRQKKLTPLQKQAWDMATRPMLHAHYLRFKHPSTFEVMEFQVEPPEDFQSLIRLISDETK